MTDKKEATAEDIIILCNYFDKLCRKPQGTTTLIVEGEGIKLILYSLTIIFY